MRADLLALTDDALIELSNKGTVRSAHKRLDAGGAPALTLDADGTVHATFEDGVTCRLPPGVPLRDADCSCPASRLCRHRIMVVIALRAHADDDAPAADEGPLPELDVSDEILESRLGKRLLARARQAWQAGFEATVRFGRPTEVQLPTCTLRFLVPWDLAHVRCDCKQAVDCEHVALAVWTLGRVDGFSGERRVAVGGEGRSDDRELLAEVLALQADLLHGGWAGAFSALQARLAALTQRLDKARCVWLVDLLADLEDAVGHYEERSATADAVQIGRLLGELGLRAAATPTDASPRSALHGASHAGTTELDRVTLYGLGARYRRRGRRGELQLFFVDSDVDDALVMSRTYDSGDDEVDAPTGPEVGERRVAGQQVLALAVAARSTDRAVRKPNREVKIGVERGSSGGGRSQGRRIREAGRSLAEVRAFLAARQPAVFDARVKARQVVMTRFVAVGAMGWDPGRQLVWAWVLDEVPTEDNAPAGAMLIAEWRPETPGAPAAVVDALRAGTEVVLAAEARLRAGQLWLQPTAIGWSGRYVCPDLEPEREIPDLVLAPLSAGDTVLTQAVDAAAAHLARLVVRGLGHLTVPQRQSCASRARDLAKLGLDGLGQAFAELAEDAPDGACDRVASWRRAWAWVVGLGHVMAVEP